MKLAAKLRWLVALAVVSLTAPLTDAIIVRQSQNGSWTNPAEAFRENDPLVATSFACIALANCRSLPQLMVK